MELETLHKCKKHIFTWDEMSRYLQHWRDHIWKLGIFNNVIYYEIKDKAWVEATSNDMSSINISFGYVKSQRGWEFFYNDIHNKNKTRSKKGN